MSMAADDVQCWTTEEVAKACGVAVAVERQKCIEAVCPSCREGKTLEWHQEWRKVGAGAIRGWLHVENRGMGTKGYWPCKADAIHERARKEREGG
jgi:hypothetical protein